MIQDWFNEGNGTLPVSFNLNDHGEQGLSNLANVLVLLFVKSFISKKKNVFEPSQLRFLNLRSCSSINKENVCDRQSAFRHS